MPGKNERSNMTTKQAIERLKTDAELSFKETLGPAMEITDQGKADEYRQLLIDRYVRLGGHSPEKATNIVNQNLGYYAGYYSGDIQERVNRLFRTVHPIFETTIPTAKEAFELGLKAGRNNP